MEQAKEVPGDTWQKLGTQIKADTKNLLAAYSKDYCLEIRQVVDTALNFYFKMSGYDKDGYNTIRQAEAVKDFNTLEDLPAPSLSCQALDLYATLVRGGLDGYPEEIRRLARAGETEKARAGILKGGD